MVGSQTTSRRLPFRWMLISDRRQMGPDPELRAAERLRQLQPRQDRTESSSGLAHISPAALQWREKEQSPGDVYRSLFRVKRLLNSDESNQNGPGLNPVPLFVNDRVDIALALGIHVHLTETSLPTRVVRDLLPPPLLVGRSVHSLEGARRAEGEGADYVLFGPIFDTPSKRAFGEPQGLDALQNLSSTLRIAVVAVGGIAPGNLESVLTAGASAWAAIGAAWKS